MIPHETVQNIVDELMDRAKLNPSEKDAYRQRIGRALLMEAVETAELFAALEEESV